MNGTRSARWAWLLIAFCGAACASEEQALTPIGIRSQAYHAAATLTDSVSTAALTLFRPGGAYNSPMYALAIYPDGRVVYHGFENVKKRRTARSRIAPEQVTALLTWLDREGYVKLEAVYKN